MQECKRVHLSNGLKVLLIPSKAHPVIALQAWIQFGSADEIKEEAGLAHLFEHLLFKGTKKRGVGQIAKDIESSGGDLNAFTSFDQTVMHVTLPSNKLELGIDVLADALINSQVPPEEMKREIPVVLEEIKRRNDNPASIAGDILRQEIFKGHSYSRPIIGYPKTVSTMSRTQILKRYKEYYNSKNIFMVLSGDFSEAKAKQLLEKHFKGLPKGKKLARKPLQDKASKRGFKFIKHKCVDTFANITWQTPGINHCDIAALDALALIWGQGESSFLKEDLIYRTQLLRSIGAYCWSPKERGIFNIGLKGSGNIAKKFPEICKEIKRSISRSINEDELEKAKRNLLAHNIYSKESVDGLAEKYAHFESLTGKWEDEEKYNANIESLTIQKILDVKEKYIQWEKAFISGIVPEKTPLPKALTQKKQKKAHKTKNNKQTIVRWEQNGLKVLMLPDNKLPTFGMRWIGLGGTRLEKAELSGVGTLWARTVTEGGINSMGYLHKKNDINQLIDFSCSSLSAVHGRNSWRFYVDGLSRDFHKLADMTMSLYHNPLFEKEDFLLEKRHLLEDLKSLNDSPTALLYKNFYSKIFKNHPYARKQKGDIKIIKKLTQSDLRNYHAEQLKQSQLLCVNGNICEKEVQQFLEKHFGSKRIRQTKQLTKKIKISKIKENQLIQQKLIKEQSHILLGYPTADISSEDRWALAALSAVLSGQGGRLFLELRDKLSLCYSVSPSQMEGLDGGHFSFYIGTSPEKVTTAINALQTEIKKLCDKKVPMSEWKRAKDFFIGNHLIDKQRASSRATEVALCELYNIDISDELEFEKKFKKITPADLQRVALKYFSKKNAYTLSLVHPTEFDFTSLNL